MSAQLRCYRISQHEHDANDATASENESYFISEV